MGGLGSFQPPQQQFQQFQPPPPQGGGKGFRPSVREGDWICGSCGNHNYSSKVACNKCGELLRPEWVVTAAAAKGGKGAGGGGGQGNRREGDWDCIRCGNHNYASRDVC